MTRRKIYRRSSVSFFLLLLVLLLGSRSYPRINEIRIAGNQHHSREAILALAKIDVGQPLLWVNYRSLQALVRDPWVKHVVVNRKLPHQLDILLEEREPYAIAHVDGGSQADSYQLYAYDGTLLTEVGQNIYPELIQVSGWGEDRSAEAFELLRLLSDMSPKMLHYTPSGFEVILSKTKLFTPNLEMLRLHWAGFSQGLPLNQGQTNVISVNSWGVSVQ